MNILAAFGMIGLLTATLGFIVGWFIQSYRHVWRHIGKSWVAIVPETVGTELTVIRTKLKDGKFDMPSRNHDAVRGDKDRMLPQGNVAYQARGDIKGPFHIMSSYGANLKAPPKLQAAEVIEKIAVADWLADYQRQPTPAEARTGGAFAEHLMAAFAKAKDVATNFLIWDPLAYMKACGENDMQDFLNAQGGPRDPWYAKAAFFLIVGVLGLLLLLFGIVSLKVLPALQQANAGA